MYYVKAKNLHEKYKTVHLTEDKLYAIDSMDKALIQNNKGDMEFMLTNDKGVTKEHHSDWFHREIIWKEE